MSTDSSSGSPPYGWVRYPHGARRRLIDPHLTHQVDVLELVAEHNRIEGRTVAMVLHALNLACRYAAGPPTEVA